MKATISQILLTFQVRKVEYVDKKEEEWEEFQKMIAEETKVIEFLVSPRSIHYVGRFS